VTMTSYKARSPPSGLTTASRVVAFRRPCAARRAARQGEMRMRGLEPPRGSRGNGVRWSGVARSPMEPRLAAAEPTYAASRIERVPGTCGHGLGTEASPLRHGEALTRAGWAAGRRSVRVSALNSWFSEPCFSYAPCLPDAWPDLRSRFSTSVKPRERDQPNPQVVRRRASWPDS
jgi:hypothetical protein